MIIKFEIDFHEFSHTPYSQVINPSTNISCATAILSIVSLRLIIIVAKETVKIALRKHCKYIFHKIFDLYTLKLERKNKMLCILFLTFSFLVIEQSTKSTLKGCKMSVKISRPECKRETTNF